MVSCATFVHVMPAAMSLPNPSSSISLCLGHGAWSTQSVAATSGKHHLFFLAADIVPGTLHMPLLDAGTVPWDAPFVAPAC